MMLRNDALRSIAILAAAVGGVAVISFGLVTLISPTPPTESAAPSAAPSLALDTPPTAAGGNVTVEGDRAGTLVLNRLTSTAGYEAVDDRFEIVLGPARLEGPDGAITFSRDPDEGVMQVDYDGLTAYLDPGDCSVTTGAHDLSLGLVSAEIACAEVSDIRGGGTISLQGIIALPVDLIGIRDELPPSGGSLEAGTATIAFDEAIGLIGPSVVAETGRVPLPLASADSDWVVGVEYDPATDDYVMTAIGTRNEPATVAPPCPLGAQGLGMLSPQTSVVRLDFDCPDMPLPNGETGSVVGSIVVDLTDTRP